MPDWERVESHVPVMPAISPLWKHPLLGVDGSLHRPEHAVDALLWASLGLRLTSWRD
jgi:hypothetical protein